MACTGLCCCNVLASSAPPELFSQTCAVLGMNTVAWHSRGRVWTGDQGDWHWYGKLAVPKDMGGSHGCEGRQLWKKHEVQ